MHAYTYTHTHDMQLQNTVSDNKDKYLTVKIPEVHTLHHIMLERIVSPSALIVLYINEKDAYGCRVQGLGFGFRVHFICTSTKRMHMDLGFWV
jgi:hypothetical protein